MAAHAMLLACLLFLFPEGQFDVGAPASGVEVVLLPAVMAQGAQLDIPAPEISKKPETVAVEQSAPSIPESVEHPVAQQSSQPQASEPVTVEAPRTELELASSGAVAEPGPAVQQTVAEADYATTQAQEEERNHAVRQRLEHFKHYPASARRRGIEGAVDVSFRLNAQGIAEDMQLVSGSGYSILDDAALTTVRRAEPFPVQGGSYRFRLLFTRS